MSDEMPLCILCRSKVTGYRNIGDGAIVTCPECGEYEHTGIFGAILPKDEGKRAILSVMCRNQFESNKKKVALDSSKIKEFLEHYKSYSVKDKVNRLIEYVGSHTEPGLTCNIEKCKHVTISSQVEQQRYFRDYLAKIGLAEVNGWHIKLTPEGWERYQDVDSMLNSSICFIAMSFTDESVEDRYHEAIEPVLEKLGLTPILIKDVEHNEDVVFKIINEIKRCRLLIADTCGKKNNVYYEAETKLHLADLFGFDEQIIKSVGKIENIKTPEDFRKLAALNKLGWKQLLKKSARKISVGGAPLKTKLIDSHASVLVRKMEMKFPTAAFAAQLERDKKSAIRHNETIVKVFSKHPKIDLLTTNIDEYFRKRKLSVGRDEDSEDVKGELKKIQRIFRLAPSYQKAKALLEEGFDSAQIIAAMGESQFISRFAKNPTFTKKEAKAVYQKAVNTHTAAMLVVGELYESLQPPFTQRI